MLFEKFQLELFDGNVTTEVDLQNLEFKRSTPMPLLGRVIFRFSWEEIPVCRRFPTRFQRVSFGGRTVRTMLDGHIVC